MVNRLLARTSIRYLNRHPWQTWLTILGISLGVAVVVAVDLANSSAKRSFAHSLELVTGKATHHIIGNTKGIPESVYSELRTQHGIRNIAPLMSGNLLIQGRSFTLLGVDPLAEFNFRASAINLSMQSGQRLFSETNQVSMSEETANKLNVAVGDFLKADHRRQSHQIQLSNILSNKHPLAAQGLLIADISVAQELLNRLGRLDRIDLVLESPMEQERIQALLPPDLEIVASGARSQALLQMTQAFHTNLSAMSLLALLVGGFLIYNTMTFMVLQRRKTLGTLRALGVTGSQLFAIVLVETATLACVGILLGLLIGTLLGQGLVQLVARTINDLYYTLEVSRFMLSPISLLKGIGLGITVSLLAAFLPALEASRSKPISVQQHSSLHLRVQRYLPYLTLTGLTILLLGIFLAYLSTSGLVVGFVALAMVIMGVSLMVPYAVKISAQAAQRCLASGGSPINRIAIRGISAGLSRTGLAVAALTLAVATTIGVGIMIDSFRNTVADWLDQSLSSDIYVTLPGRAGSAGEPGLPANLIESLEQIPGVASIWLNRSALVESQWGPVRLMAVSDATDNRRGFNLKQGNPDKVRTAFFAGKGILISEPLAFHRQLKVNDQVYLKTVAGNTAFSVLGVFYDYTSSNGLIVIPRQLYQQHWQDDAVTSVGIFQNTTVDPAVLIDQIRQLVRQQSGENDIRVTANRTIKQVSLAIFDRTFTITQVLRLLSVLVAFIGILSALMALQLERTAEFALLRATGATPSEVKRIIYMQTGIMGLFAGILAIPLGYLMSLLLIDVINLRSFGWSMAQHVAPSIVLEGVGLAIVAALLAGIYPARHAAKLAVAQSLREE